MGSPKVSIIWLNYNSMKMIDLVLESLNAVLELDYPNDRYEIIVVDNGSIDGSFEKIRGFLEKRNNGLRKKIIRLNSNLGFTGGNNIGFKVRDKESKYIVTLNNDAVPFKESLKTMVDYAEQYNVGGLNGIMLRYGRADIIDEAGALVDELLCTYSIGAERPAPWLIKRPFYVTYASGAYALYRVAHVLKSMGEKLFYDELFGFWDDAVLGLKLWNNHYKVITIPEIVATHRRGATFRKRDTRALTIYLGERNRVAVSCVTNTRYKHAIRFHSIRAMLLGAFKLMSIDHTRALYDGIKLGTILKRRYGLFIDLRKAPILRISLRELMMYYFAGARKRLLKLYEEKVTKLIKRLEVN